jgi:tape measure domain-containing protein
MGDNLSLAMRVRADISAALQAVRQMGAGTRELVSSAQRTASSSGQATQAMRAQQQAASGLRGELAQLPGLLRNVAGLMGIAFGVAEIARASEAWAGITNRLRLVTEGNEELAQAQAALFEIAQGSRQPLEATAELYQRIASNADSLKLSGDGVAAVVDAIAKSLALSGASSAAAEGALGQLGQVFASGAAQGEEMNSILDGAPALAKAIADGLGVAVGDLKELTQEGKITADAIVQALLRQGAAIDEQFGRMEATGGQALTVLGNSFVRLVGQLDQATGAGTEFGDMVIGLSEWIDSGALADGMIDSMTIWIRTFEAVSDGVAGLQIDLTGLAQEGESVSGLLGRAFREMPVNVRAAIQIAVVEILALFDRAVAYATYSADLIRAAFTSATAAGAQAALDARLAAADAARTGSIDSILAERDAILEVAAAERTRREAERKALDEQSAARRKAIAQLREQARANAVNLSGGKGGKAKKDRSAQEAERYVAQLERQAAVLGMNAAEVRAYELAEKKLTGALLQRAQAAVALLDAEERKRRADEASRANAGLQVELLRQSGNEAEAAMLEIQTRFAQMRNEFAKTGNEAGLALIDQLVPIEQVRARLEQVKAEIESALSAQQRGEQSIDAQVSAGLITEMEGRSRLVELHRQTASVIEQYMPSLREMAALPGPMGEQARIALQQMETQLITLRATTDEIQNALRNGLQGGLEEALSGLANGTMNLRDALNALVLSVADSMAQLAAQQLAQQATAGIMSMFGGGGGNEEMTAGAAAVAGSAAALSAAGGTLVTGAAAIQAAAASLAAANAAGAAAGLGFAAGGYTGPGGKYEPAGVVHRGEFVTRQEVTQQPGALPFLLDFNRRGMAALFGWRGYADGGLVGLPVPAIAPARVALAAAAPSATLHNKQVFNLIDSPDRIASVLNSPAGVEAVTVMLSRDPAKFRSILGVS